MHLCRPGAMLELAEYFQVDGDQLWSEFLVYRLFAKNINITTVMTPFQVVAKEILSPAKRETMSYLLPLISDLLARLAVLPATNAEVVKHEAHKNCTAESPEQHPGSFNPYLYGRTKGNRMGSFSSTSAVGILGKQET